MLQVQNPEKIYFLVKRTVTHTLICAYSKALESDCMLRFYPLPLNYDIASHGRIDGNYFF
jgi:hypothetical protein